MNKEKQIEKMAKILNRVCTDGCSECPYHDLRHEEYACLDLNMASTLYNAGYRKTADVAREIFEEIENKLQANMSGEFRGDSVEWFDYFDLHLAEDIAELKKKYTEEGKWHK